MIAEMLTATADRLAKAEEVGRSKAAENLPGDLVNDPRLVEVFVAQWMRGAVSDAVREIRNIAERARPRRSRVKRAA